jgi:hypothetical protein
VRSNLLRNFQNDVTQFSFKDAFGIVVKIMLNTQEQKRVLGSEV